MQIEVDVLVRAPLAVVWKAWTSPEDIVHWNAASDAWHTTGASVDLRREGTFLYRMEARDGSAGFDFEGVYTVVEPRRRIEFCLADDRVVRVTFAETERGVMVTEIFDSDEEHPLEQQRAGWQAILDRFARYVEAAIASNTTQ